MKKYQEIAKCLGITVPACVISVATIQAANAQIEEKSDYAEFSDNEVVSLLTNTLDTNSPGVGEWMAHTDSHSDFGGNHVNRHSNLGHADRHTNVAATTKYNYSRNPDGTTNKVPYCSPHSDSHTNRNPVNNHTNSGNAYHTNRHVNRDTKVDC